MKPLHFVQSSMAIAVGIVLCLSTRGASATETPSPTPTPRPGTLADAAARTTLNRNGCTDASGRIVISDANLPSLAENGTVSVAGALASGRRARQTTKKPNPSVRSAWRQKVLAQKRVITDLERKKLGIQSRIDLIDNGRLTARSLANLQRAEIDLRAVEEEIRHELTELRRLIREARGHGAEPGWFR